MLGQRGFRRALLASVAIHVIAFLTVPLGGKVGEAREHVITRVSETAIEFVRIVKPKPPPKSKPPPARTSGQTPGGHGKTSASRSGSSAAGT